jgi:DNA-binding transcriptional ArsR family regulator
MSMTTTPGQGLVEAAQVFQLLADQSRLRILYLLLERGELHVNAISAELGFSQVHVSLHLGRLRRLHLVQCRREGQRVFYRVCSEVVAALLERAGKPVGSDE